MLSLSLFQDLHLLVYLFSSPVSPNFLLFPLVHTHCNIVVMSEKVFLMRMFSLKHESFVLRTAGHVWSCEIRLHRDRGCCYLSNVHKCCCAGIIKWFHGNCGEDNLFWLCDLCFPPAISIRLCLATSISILFLSDTV